jgi:hypothetical protein
MIQLKDYNIRRPGNWSNLKGLHANPLRVLKCYLYYHVEKRTPVGTAAVKAFNVAVKAFDVKEYEWFQMSSTYGEMKKCTSSWATLTAKDNDEFRMSPDYLASTLEIKHDSSFPLPDDPPSSLKIWRTRQLLLSTRVW